MDTITATTLPDWRTLTGREHKHLRPRRFTLAQLAGWFVSNDGGSRLKALLRHRRPRHSIPLRRDLPAAYQPRTGDKIQVAA